jgi:hypothetical protein
MLPYLRPCCRLPPTTFATVLVCVASLDRQLGVDRRHADVVAVSTDLARLGECAVIVTGPDVPARALPNRGCASNTVSRARTRMRLRLATRSDVIGDR